MRYQMLISAVIAILLLGQPVAVAQPLTTGLQQSSSELSNISIPQNTDRDDEQHSNAFEWSEQIQQLQIATSQIIDSVGTSESINTLKNDFQSKLSDLATAVNLTNLQEGLVSNISASLGTAQEWSNNLAADTKDKLGDFQPWNTNLIKLVI